MMGEELLKRIKEETERKLDDMMNQEGLQPHNIDMMYSLMDIHKDIANEEYWKEKGEHMRYSRGYSDHRGMEHDTYGRRKRDSRGRYMDGGMDGRRYRGHDMIDEMYNGYTEYHDGRSRYGAGPETMEPLEAMLERVVDFVEMLKHDAGSQQEMDLIRHYTKKISEM